MLGALYIASSFGATSRNAAPRIVASKSRSSMSVQSAPSRKSSVVSRSRAALPNVRNTAVRSTAARAARIITESPAKQRVVGVRAAIPVTAPSAETMGDGYVGCRDAYFACMDQFCALRDEQYRRCTCSSRLAEMRERERNFAAATGMLKDFESNNLNVVDKSPAEVRAMYKASEGEAAMQKDVTSSAKSLSGINDILANKNSDVTDNMGNMTNIWGTTGLVGGADLTSLESTALYAAVHAQCAEMVGEMCGRIATFNMVVSAYGMYIEQDCTTYAVNLDKQQRAVNNATKQAKGALAVARLDDYNLHNADAISICLDNVRNDMYGTGGCGPDNVQCLDHTGRFLNILTGEPIYSPDFWMLENAISLSGHNPLQSSVNMPYIVMLNQKKSVAKDSLDKCREVADDVWDEYLRQTLVDISQKQFEKVHEVRDSCINTVSMCYDEKLEQLKNFANDISQENIGALQIGLTEQMCMHKLETCAMLYGGGPPGLERLRKYVYTAQTTKLENNCEKYLNAYVLDICTPINDAVHGFPYQCRFLEPGKWWPDPTMVTGGTLYDKLRSKASEVCVRADAGTWTHEVKMIINKIIDGVKIKMDDEMYKECSRVGGMDEDGNQAVWYSGTSNHINRDFEKNVSTDAFINSVGAHADWGLCTTTVPFEAVNRE